MLTRNVTFGAHLTATDQLRKMEPSFVVHKNF